MIDLNALFHRRPGAIVVIGAAVFGALSFLIALRPAIDMNAAAAAPSAVRADPAVARGRALYLAEGCGYCHSQFVRPLFIDAAYGRPSTVADYADATPPLVGTERTGPDLANVGIRQPSVMWNLLHLFNPRSMVPESVMPGFPWYFEIVDREPAPVGAPDGAADYVLVLPEPFLPAGKAALPRREALDLVAYLQSLRQE
jgi:cytochrome c oxidase cbb3-type subunit II